MSDGDAILNTDDVGEKVVNETDIVHMHAL